MWIKQHPFLHPVFFGSASKLKAFAKSLIPACVLDDAKNVMAVAAQVALQEEHPLVQNPAVSIDIDYAASTESACNASSHHTQRQKLMRSFILCSVLLKLACEQKSDIRSGLNLEELMAKQLLQDSSAGTTRIRVQEIASAPLVNRTGLAIHSVNCSVDYVAKIHAPGEQTSKLAGIECNGRVKAATASAQRKQLRQAARAVGLNPNEKYIIIDAMSDAFPFFVNVRHEALQLRLLVCVNCILQFEWRHHWWRLGPFLC
jgi:hypothetical protein